MRLCNQPHRRGGCIGALRLTLSSMTPKAVPAAHRGLKLPPTFWPCLPDPDPNGSVSPGARALYEQLDATLTA